MSMPGSSAASASAQRSVPLRAADEVITTAPPKPRTTSAMRVSSVATTTALAPGTALAADADAAMATAGLRCSPETYAHLVGDQAQGRVGGTTVVANGKGHALYFSKRVIPHVPAAMPDPHAAVLLHLGVYAYRPAALAAYAAMPPSRLETLEGLEQLRFLEGDRPIRLVPFEPVGWDCIELNNPEDVPVIEAVLRRRGLV